MTLNLKRFLLALSLFSICSHVLAQKVFTEQGKAIRGYDAVAYHSMQQPVKGNDSLAFSWNGALWLFSTSGNLALFKAQPEKYAPAYGGYCAYGVSEDHLSPTDPNAFTIVHDTLYLNYSPKVKELWLKDTLQRIHNANRYWIKLK